MQRHLALAVVLALTANLPAIDPTRVLVVYNANWPDQNRNGVGDSLEVARWYALRRGVPQANLLGIACTPTGTVYGGQAGWQTFWDEFYTPLMAKLSSLGPTNVDVLLFCHGVPHQLTVSGTRAIDDVLKTPHMIGTRAVAGLAWRGNPYYEYSPGIAPDRGRFDHSYTFGGTAMYLTARLDGIDAHASIDLVEQALYAEHHVSNQPGFYTGNCYVDTRYKKYTPAELASYPAGYGSYAGADFNMAKLQEFFANRGWPFLWEYTADEIGEGSAVFQTGASALTAPAALFYGGWYNYRKYPDVWTWLPGSVAVDLNSNSIQTFRTGAVTSFLGAAFARGLTAGAGAIAEPFVNGHPQPEKLLYFMLEGYDFAEAAMLSNPKTCWVNVTIGDPLYAPARAGRVPKLDTIAPQQPAIAIDEPSDTERTVVLAIDSRGRDPEVVTAAVDFGSTPGYGSIETTGPVYRAHHRVTLSNLTADRLYHLRTTVSDPAGHRTTTGNSIVYTKAFAPALAGINPPSQTAPAQSSAPLDLTVGHAQGVLALTSLSVRLSAPHMQLQGFDITALLPAMLVSADASPEFDLVNFRLAFPTSLPPGTFTIDVEVRGAGSSNPVMDSATVTIQ